MRKETPLKIKVIKGILTTFLFFSFILAFSPTAHAGVCDEDPPKWRIDIILSCKLKEINPLVSIQRTISDAASALVTNFLSTVAFNVNADDLGACGTYILLEEAPGMQAVADELYTGPEQAEARTAGAAIGCDFNNTVFGSKANGSLMGVTKLASNVVMTESAPVNLAYYVQHNARKIPVINKTAYAQETQYSAWGLHMVLGVWENTRNLAYAMMSVIMLVIGILIITRKRINPQTVVTMQTALPRVFISLLLITFSYPIGAIMASLVIPLIVVVLRFFFGATVENFANMNWEVMFISILIMLAGPQGLFGVVFGIVVGFITMLAMMMAFFKIIFINLKILIQIIIAPIQFAMAAIPGQEHLIQDWFKGMISKVLAIPAIFFMVALAWYWLVAVFTSPVSLDEVVLTPNPFLTGISIFRSQAATSHLLTLIMLPIMMIMTLFMSFKADKMVEGFIMGKDKKRR
jgi:hypothetical protein